VGDHLQALPHLVLQRVSFDDIRVPLDFRRSITGGGKEVLLGVSLTQVQSQRMA
jgi:hypothetical protein